MIITDKQAKAIRHKRVDCTLSKTKLAQILGVSRLTISKIERGNHKATRRVYQSVMEWLTEDL